MLVLVLLIVLVLVSVLVLVLLIVIVFVSVLVLALALVLGFKVKYIPTISSKQDQGQKQHQPTTVHAPPRETLGTSPAASDDIYL